MTVYEVYIERSGSWWAISVPELRGVFSQARRRTDVARMARDAIALYLDVPLDSFEIAVREVVDEVHATASEDG
jgi:predicted RNase H-like HicB family nuclease